jgi:hypothetical protein
LVWQPLNDQGGGRHLDFYGSKKGMPAPVSSILRPMEEGDKNYIPCLKNERGEMEWAHDQKEATVHNYFQNLLGKKLQRREGINWDMLHMPRLPDHSTDHPLDAPFSELETSAAIAELPTEKAPSPMDLRGSSTRRAGRPSKLK